METVIMDGRTLNTGAEAAVKNPIVLARMAMEHISCSVRSLVSREKTPTNVEPAIIVHGGAVAFPGDKKEKALEGTKEAAFKGYRMLIDGRSALDAVQAAICVLENNPTFDAGTGSPLTSEGNIEMDAVIMDGRTLNTGAVAAVKNVKNPIVLARMVMDHTDHCLLVGQGANQFADEEGVPRIPKENLITEENRKKFKDSFGKALTTDFSTRGHDTVGAVAIDRNGNIAFGTSTGGITNKRPGRVGDSPIAGIGGYADNNVGGISCTGHGESITRVALAYDIISLMKYTNKCTQEAADYALDQMDMKLRNAKNNFGAGVIGIGKDGNPVYSFRTEQMAWAWAKDWKLHNGVNPGENNTYTIKTDANGEYKLNKDE
ncbi:isoaspartyl peptidase/L-asparaginase-like isoform X1 [Mercenaria mercenaria]|uniref:isoaspartyl peptidase/L-asparaginase-like isoform X1 n=1 Tax=Mercenaria mercenaria TaxID=6596 RepID=UPI00234F520A|nr:isoaspartyl peptidase/L-asparaginase-like isoform X1 [Mercenaria mercenaria]XP_045192441.2 isoaspartyl peptidase/L-asparaginase-like isoform X1 [Mercenaria mercenaria]XP_045192442.2 isoaspartyl peptidase/L-asparaginase-like isoform X1 [Mercenaria mercenaria]